jgi:hypothetical protein
MLAETSFIKLVGRAFHHHHPAIIGADKQTTRFPRHKREREQWTFFQNNRVANKSIKILMRFIVQSK